MEEENNTAESSPATSANVPPESPRPLAFTIDFGENKSVDTQRQKALAEKFQKRHKRVQSLSKIEAAEAGPTPVPKHPLTGNLPRKSSFQSDGYFSSDEKPERVKSAGAKKRSDLTLFLKNVTSDRMTQSFPGSNLPSITSPEIELKDVSSPELDLISPFSPKESKSQSQGGLSNNSSTTTPGGKKKNNNVCLNCPEVSCKLPSGGNEETVLLGTPEFEFDKSDTASDTGTYTIDADNYSEEQKARMSIDANFKIEHMSVQKKTEDYIKSLGGVHNGNNSVIEFQDLKSPRSSIAKKSLISPLTPRSNKPLSPIMSPTQHLSITETVSAAGDAPTLNNDKPFMKIMFPSQNSKREGLEQNYDQGSVISVTSSGAFKPKNDKKLERRYSLTKSEIQVQAYVDNKSYTEVVNEHVVKKPPAKLTANIVNVQSIEVKNTVVVDPAAVIGKLLSPGSPSRSNLPPAVGGYSGKTSPTKIPSPIHTISRPRSRNSLSSSNVEYNSDSNTFDTDLILKPTQNFINSLQQRLSLDSDPDSDYDIKCGLQLNNTAHLLKQKASHTRHNSLDDRAMNLSNKLEHFQNKNLQGIDQTYSNLFNQYSHHNKVMQKIQNSPNNSPIKRSTSFSNKNTLNSPKNTNVILPQKESNIATCNSPNPTRNVIQRSSSTASIKPNYIRRSNQTEHQKIDRNQFADTESSSEEDFEKGLQKRKDLSNITNTRCNRTFNLRRARVDNNESTAAAAAAQHLRCPNTPEMRRKTFQPEMKQERAISVDRKPMKTNDIQSRYLLNITKRSTPPPSAKLEGGKNVPKGMIGGSATGGAKSSPGRPQVFSRTDSGRVSMRTTTKPPTTNSGSKGFKKDGSGKKQGGARSNSSLSSREVEFQNWKRRKSYDPMKAAAEGKKKEIAKRQSLGIGGQNAMTQSYTEANHSQDSSPSHSSSVHRSQSFHGTAALEQLLSSEEEEDLTLSADEGFSPPTPSPCELSPARASLRHALWERIRH